MSESLPDLIVIGVISAPHGVRGTVRIKPVGDGRHLREGVTPVLDGERCKIITSRPTPKGFLVDLAGISDRSEVEHLRGSELTLDRSELDEPEEDEVYVSDLVSLKVFDPSGQKLGTISETFPTAAHEVLVVRDEGGSTLYIPFTLEHVPEVDLSSGRVTVDPPQPDGE